MRGGHVRLRATCRPAHVRGARARRGSHCAAPAPPPPRSSPACPTPPAPLRLPPRHVGAVVACQAPARAGGGRAPRPAPQA